MNRQTPVHAYAESLCMWHACVCVCVCVCVSLCIPVPGLPARHRARQCRAPAKTTCAGPVAAAGNNDNGAQSARLARGGRRAGRAGRWTRTARNAPVARTTIAVAQGSAGVCATVWPAAQRARAPESAPRAPRGSAAPHQTAAALSCSRQRCPPRTMPAQREGPALCQRALHFARGARAAAYPGESRADAAHGAVAPVEHQQLREQVGAHGGAGQHRHREPEAPHRCSSPSLSTSDSVHERKVRVGRARIDCLEPRRLGPGASRSTMSAMRQRQKARSAADLPHPAAPPWAARRGGRRGAHAKCRVGRPQRRFCCAVRSRARVGAWQVAAADAARARGRAHPWDRVHWVCTAWGRDHAQRPRRPPASACVLPPSGSMLCGGGARRGTKCMARSCVLLHRLRRAPRRGAFVRAPLLTLCLGCLGLTVRDCCGATASKRAPQRASAPSRTRRLKRRPKRRQSLNSSRKVARMNALARMRWASGSAGTNASMGWCGGRNARRHVRACVPILCRLMDAHSIAYTRMYAHVHLWGTAPPRDYLRVRERDTHTTHAGT